MTFHEKSANRRRDDQVANFIAISLLAIPFSSLIFNLGCWRASENIKDILTAAAPFAVLINIANLLRYWHQKDGINEAATVGRSKRGEQ